MTTINANTDSNVNKIFSSKLTPWVLFPGTEGDREDLELKTYKNNNLYIRIYQKDAVSIDGYLPDELSVDFEDVQEYSIFPIVDDLINMAKENDCFYYTSNNQYILIGKEKIICVKTDKKPLVFHEYGIMDSIPVEMLE